MPLRAAKDSAPLPRGWCGTSRFCLPTPHTGHTFGTNPIFFTGAHRSPRNFLAKAYYAQLQSVFSNEESFGLDLSCAEFVKGGFLRAVDLTRPRRAHNSVVWHKVRQGSLRIDVSFADQIAANMPEHPTRVQIFKDRRRRPCAAPFADRSTFHFPPPSRFGRVTTDNSSK